MFSLVDNFKGPFLCARTVKFVFKPSEQDHIFCRKETYPVFGTETSCYVNKWTSTSVHLSEMFSLIPKSC